MLRRCTEPEPFKNFRRLRRYLKPCLVGSNSAVLVFTLSGQAGFGHLLKLLLSANMNAYAFVQRYLIKRASDASESKFLNEDVYNKGKQIFWNGQNP